MFNITKNGPNRLDITLSKKLDAASMTVALDELVEKANGINEGIILYTIIDFQLPTLEAIGIEFSRLPSMFKLMRQFKRVALLSDTYWLKKVSEFEGALLPGLEIKAFNIDQREEAESWLLQ